MPCCTYLSDAECTQPTSDAELNSLLAEVRSATGDDWRIRETVFTRRRLFRKPVIGKDYELYNHVGGPEFQIINFYRPDCDGLNFYTNAGDVAAFLYGVLAGVRSAPTTPGADR